MALSRILPMAAGFALAAALVQPVAAQQQQEWFVPGQGQQRPAQGQPAQPAQPAQGQPPAQRPAQGQQAQPAQQGQQPAQRPAQGQQAARPPAPGTPPPTAVVGIVDIPAVQQASTAFTHVRDEIERRRQRLNDDLQREQNSWREQQQQLANQRASLPAEQLRQKERDLQDRITDSQRIFRERSRAIEQAAQTAVMEIEQALGTVIRQVASSRQVNMVLPRPLVIFNDPAFDLTDEVSAQFNRVLRTVNIPPEAAETATPAAAPAQRPAANQQRR